MKDACHDSTDALVLSELARDAYRFNDVKRELVSHYIDVGANHGLVYKHLIKTGFLLEKAVLVEPLDYNFQLLRSNVAASQTPPFLVQKCLGSVAGQRQFLSLFRINNTGASQFSEKGLGAGVDSTTLNDLVTEFGILPCKTLLKVDCEGGERFLGHPSNFEVVRQCPYITGELHGGMKPVIERMCALMKDTHVLEFPAKGPMFFIRRV